MSSWRSPKGTASSTRGISREGDRWTGQDAAATGTAETMQQAGQPGRQFGHRSTGPCDLSDLQGLDWPEVQQEPDFALCAGRPQQPAMLWAGRSRALARHRPATRGLTSVSSSMATPHSKMVALRLIFKSSYA